MPDHRQRPDRQGRRLEPVDGQEGVPRGADRRGEQPADDLAGGVRRSRPADAEGDLHPRRQALPRPHPGQRAQGSRRSRWSSATPPPVVPTSPACRTTRSSSAARPRCSSAARRWSRWRPVRSRTTSRSAAPRCTRGSPGLADYLAEDELDAIRIGRRIVARLNWRSLERVLSRSRVCGPENVRFPRIGGGIEQRAPSPSPTPTPTASWTSSRPTSRSPSTRAK